MEVGPDTEGEACSQRTRSFLFGCALTSENRKFRFRKGGEDLEELLCLRMVCLGPGAPDEVHVLEAEGSSQDGRPLKVPLAALQLSVQPTVNLGGIELSPPVTFRLKTGPGPLYLSGQHLVTEEAAEEDEDDNHGGAAAQRVTPGRQPKHAQKRAQGDSLVGKGDHHLTAQQLNHGPRKSAMRPMEDATHSSKANRPSQEGLTVANNAKVKKQSKKSPRVKMAKGPPSVDEIKAKLLASVEKGGNLPKAFPKFEKFLKHCHKAEDPTCVQELWSWRQSLK